MSSNLEYPKICALCGVHFQAKKLSTQYCSHKCSQRAYKQKIKDEKLSFAVDKVKEKSKPFILQGKNSQKNNLFNIDSSSLNNKEFLSPIEASVLMGVCRSTINKYCSQGKLKCIKMNRKIFVRRKDIESLFDYAQLYQVSPRAETIKPKVVKPKVRKQQPKPKPIEQKPIEPKQHSDESITDFYTSAEAATKFNVCKSAITKRAALKKCAAYYIPRQDTV